MNALANSQLGELEKFLSHRLPAAAQARSRSPATPARRTTRSAQEILAQPAGHPAHELRDARADPDAAVRAADRRAPRRGFGSSSSTSCTPTAAGRAPTSRCSSAGSARRANATELQCVGTSATLAGRGTLDEQRAEVARRRSLLFGATVEPENVIGETLRRATTSRALDDVDARRARSSRTHAPPTTLDAVPRRPARIWIETTFGLERRSRAAAASRAPRRGRSTAPDGAAELLAELTGHSPRPVRRGDPRDADAGSRAARTRTPGSRSSPSACTSSSAAATPSTRPSSPRTRARHDARAAVRPGRPSDEAAVPARVLPRVRAGVLHRSTAPDARDGHDARAAAAATTRPGTKEPTTGFLYARARRALAGRPRTLSSSASRTTGSSRTATANASSRTTDKYLPRPLHVRPDGRLRRRRDARATASRRRFGSACAAASPTAAAAARLRQAADARRRRALERDDDPQPRGDPQPSRATRRSTRARAQAPQLHRQPAGRVAPGRPLQRLRRGRPDPLGALPGCAGRRRRRALARRARAQGVRRARASARPLRGRPDGALRRAPGGRPRAARRARATASTATSSAAGASPRPNLEQCGLLEIATRRSTSSARPRTCGRARTPRSRQAPPGRSGAHRPRRSSTTCAASWRSTSTTSTGLAGALKQRSSQFLVDPWAIDEQEELDARQVALPEARRRAAREYRGDVYVSRAAASASTYARELRTAPAGSRSTTPTRIILDLLEALRSQGSSSSVTPSTG